jgi:hypothetical protein
MPTKNNHQIKVEHNQSFLASIDQAIYPEWATVTIFYIVVHLIEKLRAHLGDGHSGSHQNRLDYLSVVHAAIHPHVSVLQNASMLARYQSRADFFNMFQPDEVKTILIDQHLHTVQTYVDAMLKHPVT